MAVEVTGVCCSGKKQPMNGASVKRRLLMVVVTVPKSMSSPWAAVKRHVSATAPVSSALRARAPVPTVRETVYEPVESKAPASKGSPAASSSVPSTPGPLTVHRHVAAGTVPPWTSPLQPTRWPRPASSGLQETLTVAADDTGTCSPSLS